MFKINHSVKKYIVSTFFVTSLVFTPIFSGSILAYGGPDTEAETSQNNGNNAPVSTDVKEVEENKAPVSNKIISKGDRGEDVRTLQTKLQDRGYTANLDGIYGSETEGAVRNLQADQGIAVDGIAGPDTNNALSISASSGNDTSNDNGSTSNEVTIEETTEEEDAPKPQTASISVDGSAPAQSDVVSTAQNLVGSPYAFGGTTPAGFDSSGFINYVFDEAGVDLNRTHAAMWANDGVHVDSPSVGDVVFFENTYQGGVSHSGIYLGNNQMIHAGTEDTGVEVTSMAIDYWDSRYIGAKYFQ